MRPGDRKLVRSPRRGENGGWQPYRLEDDLAEENNLAEQEPEKLQQLVERWEARSSEMIVSVKPAAS